MQNQDRTMRGNELVMHEENEWALRGCPAAEQSRAATTRLLRQGVLDTVPRLAGQEYTCRGRTATEIVHILHRIREVLYPQRP